jgi:hypothetical protein
VTADPPPKTSSRPIKAEANILADIRFSYE